MATWFETRGVAALLTMETFAWVAGFGHMSDLAGRASPGLTREKLVVGAVWEAKGSCGC